MGVSLDKKLIAAVQGADPVAALEQAKALLSRGANAQYDEGWALVHAAGGNDHQICELLLEHGAPVHGRNHLALRSAVRGCHVDSARMLLAHGSDARVLDIEARMRLLRKLPAEDVCMARLLFPEWEAGQLSLGARDAGNEGLADRLEADGARKISADRIAARRSLQRQGP